MKDEILRVSSCDIRSELKTASGCLVGVKERYRTSQGLPAGTQAKLVQACVFSQALGYPINTLTTINAEHLLRMGNVSVFAVGHLWDGLRSLIELMRHWHTERRVPWVAVWSREVAGARANHSGEHWHIGHHLPESHRWKWVEQVAVWTGEPHDGAPLIAGAGEIAHSEHRAWHISVKRPGGRGPEGIGAYLGKAEPNKLRKYGSLRCNMLKYDPRKIGGEGPIQGKRYGISRAIDQKAQTAWGF